MITEIRGEVTDDDGNPVLTSIVTLFGESTQHRRARRSDRADRRRDAAIAAMKRMIAGQSKGPAPDAQRAQPKNMLRRLASSW